jgi:hypothetical protein
MEIKGRETTSRRRRRVTKSRRRPAERSYANPRLGLGQLDEDRFEASREVVHCRRSCWQAGARLTGGGGACGRRWRGGERAAVARAGGWRGQARAELARARARAGAARRRGWVEAGLAGGKEDGEGAAAPAKMRDLQAAAEESRAD